MYFASYTTFILSMDVLFGILHFRWKCMMIHRMIVLEPASSLSSVPFLRSGLRSWPWHSHLMDALGIWHSKFFRVLPGILFQFLISFELLLEFANFFWIGRASFCNEFCPSAMKWSFLLLVVYWILYLITIIKTI